MLKYFNVESYIDRNNVDGEENERLYNLATSGHPSFKDFNDGSIIYKLELEDELNNYFGIDISGNSVLLKDVLNDQFYGGESIIIGDSEFSISNCIKKLSGKLPYYTNRILKSADSYEETSVIIKEQMAEVFTEFLNDGYKIIDNGKFSW